MPEEKKEEKKEITILDRRDYVTFPKLKQELPMRALTYVVDNLPPRTIFIEREGLTTEKELELIKKDIQDRKVMQPETHKI